MKTKTAINSALASVFAMGIMTTAGNAIAADPDKEKCYGVVKAGKNDCGAADKSHDCSGKATKDADPNEWVYVPKGLCDKLVGGTRTPTS